MLIHVCFALKHWKSKKKKVSTIAYDALYCGKICDLNDDDFETKLNVLVLRIPLNKLLKILSAHPFPCSLSKNHGSMI